MSDENNYIEINKKLWNNKTDVHYASEFYDNKSFLKGRNPLNSIELDLLGDITGKSILHLQCHFGQDSIALSRMGAKVTGVDLSDKAITRAKELAELVGTDTRFIESDVFKVDEILDEKFDIVYTSYGVIGWLPDLNRWAEVINHFLKPGGKLVFVEFHPVVWMFDDEFKHVQYSYFNVDTIIEEDEGTYTDFTADLKNKSVCWNHPLDEVYNALKNNGLPVTGFNEYNYSPYNCFQSTTEVKSGKFHIKGYENKLPMVYSMVAVKEG